MSLKPTLLLLLSCFPFIQPTSVMAKDVGDSSLISHAPWQWKQLPSIPDPVGYAAPFAGTSNEVLLVAGGANFPDRPPWEGGKKIWHDRIYALVDLNGTWQEIGRLPAPRAYGVSISTPKGVWCIGGSDANKHHQDSCLLEWLQTSRTIRITPNALPTLPQPCANACGVISNSVIYIAGGQTSPTSTSTLHTFWSLDLNASPPQWLQLPPWPGSGRILATMAVLDDAIYLIGGADLKPNTDSKVERIWLRDAYRYHPQHGWQKLADLPRSCVAAPSPALTNPQERLLLIAGGDDGSQLQTPPTQHPGFPKQALIYDVSSNHWELGPPMPVSLVTTPVVRWQNHDVIPGGEIRPGIRTNQVFALPHNRR